MNINIKIYEKIKNIFYEYDCDEVKVKEFISELNFEKRQDKAAKIIEDIFKIHQKEHLDKFISTLAKIEPGIQKSQERIRDHVVHTLLCFCLGIYIKENFHNVKEFDNFQWIIASLLHDIAYPLQIVQKILQTYSDDINGVINNTQRNTIVKGFNVELSNLTKLKSGRDIFKLMQKCLDDWELDFNAKTLFLSMRRSGYICHGIIGGITALHIMDALYYENNGRSLENENGFWSWSYFNEKIVPACTAIYIHNLKNEKFVNKKKLSFEKASLAALLRLTDNLQEWERPLGNKSSGLDANQFDINIVEDKLIFKVNTENVLDADLVIIDKIKSGLKETIKLSFSDAKIEIH